MIYMPPTSDYAIVDLSAKISEFVVSNFLFGDASRKPAETESLIEKGIIDSTGVLELIEFLESTFGISIREEETIPQNLDSLAALSHYVLGKLSSGN
jgi:acyl carrier protein